MFREPWPRGTTRVFFSNIWHDWNFRTCAWLAARAYEALPRGGRIMLHEMLLDDGGGGAAAAAAFSMLMLLATQGQQFTFAEVQRHSRGRGFEGIETLQTAELLLDHDRLQAVTARLRDQRARPRVDVHDPRVVLGPFGSDAAERQP